MDLIFDYWWIVGLPLIAIAILVGIRRDGDERSIRSE